MNTTIKVALTRLRRIDYILHQQADRYITNPTDVRVYEKGDEKFPFPTAAWLVTEAVYSAGLDPCFIDKKEIFAWANHVLLGGQKPTATAAAAPQPEPAKQAQRPACVEDESPAAESTGGAVLNVPVRIAIYTLLLSALELTRLDKQSDAKDLANMIEGPARAYLNALNKKSQGVLDPQVQAAPKPVEAQPEPAKVAEAEKAQVPIPA